MRDLALVLLAACSDYNLENEKDDPAPFDSGGTDTVDTSVTDETGPTETATVPDTCDMAAPGAGTVPIVEDCEGVVVEPIKDPWNMRIEWDYASGGTGV